MPVPTDTFRKTRRLNVIFALSAVALLGSVGWMVMDDYNREFRPWQRQARVWQASIAADQLQRATNDDAERRLKRIRRQIEAIEIDPDLVLHVCFRRYPGHELVWRT